MPDKDEQGPGKSVLISGVYYPPQVGGISQFMEYVAQSLGRDYVCCLTTIAGQIAINNRLDGPAVYRFPSLRDTTKIVRACSWAAAVSRIMLRERPRSAILGSIDDGAYGLWLRRWLDLPFISFAYGNEILSAVKDNYEAPLRALKNANRVLACSRYTANLAQNAGADPLRVEIVYPGCDSDFFRPQPPNKEWRQRLLGGRQNGRVILTVGNLVARKGHDMVIRALPQLCKRIPDLTYLIVGDGPHRNELQTLANELSVADHVVFAGTIMDQDMPELYALSDVFAMISRARLEHSDVEGFGLVFLEANACGKPVVGGFSGGVPDAVVDGVTGMLVDPHDVQGVAGALEKLLNDEELRKRLGEQGRARVKSEFRWKQVGDRVLEILGSVQREGPIQSRSNSRPSRIVDSI
jgi:phosphatidylinositol alpha-1,6-mannosyltransferase